MADRSGAEIAGNAFKYLAEYPCVETVEIAKKFYDSLARIGDFTADQMYCDDALITLGLAYYAPCEGWDGEVIEDCIHYKERKHE